MNDEYKKMLERFEQICQNAKKELCGKKEKELEKRFIEKISKELTINGYDETEYWLARVEALDNNAINDILEENKRLNNIINELENYIRARADDNNTCSICSVMTDDLLNILKGCDKE